MTAAPRPILILLLVAACSAPQSASSTVDEASRRCPPTSRNPACRDAGIDAAPPMDASTDASPDAQPDAAVPAPASHPRIMASQFPRLGAALAAGTPAATRWRAAVDRWVGGADLWGFDSWNAALLGQLTGKPAYCAKAVAVIDAQVTAAEVKISAGAAPVVADDSYLGVGQMIGDLALVYDWCSPTDGQRARWIAYSNQAVANVWNHATANWGGVAHSWTGWATDDPGDNYYYSFLRATMLLGLATEGENAQAGAWIARFRERLVRLDAEFTAEQADGGSREGTGYGVALRNLFELYALWQWTTGERIADLTPHTRATIPTVIAQILPGGAWKAPIGDQSRDSTAALFDYDRALFLILGALYPDDHASKCAVSMLAASSVPSMQNSFMLAYDFIFAPTGATPNDLPLVRYASGIGEILARTTWASDATWLGMIAGPYTQSHAHQDQGSLMIFRGGWLVYDAVIASKSGLPQGAEAHSLVRIDGATQRTGGTVTALHVGPGYVYAAMDLSGAYGVTAKVRRQVLWLQPDVIVVRDHVVSTKPQTWQLVVPVAPVIVGALATITVGAHTMRVTRVLPTAASWSVYDFRALPDFTGGFRLDETQPAGDHEYVTVIAIDSTASVPNAIAWSDDGATFSAAGQQVTVAEGIDPL